MGSRGHLGVGGVWACLLSPIPGAWAVGGHAGALTQPVASSLPTLAEGWNRCQVTQHWCGLGDHQVPESPDTSTQTIPPHHICGKWLQGQAW